MNSPLGFDPDVPQAARRYDAWLGGKDNFAADRASAEAITSEFDSIRIAVAENRKWMQRAVHYLAQRGIRQFIDIGVGLPSTPNVHEVAQGVNPTARVAYYDNDPLVGIHARALFVSGPDGAISFSCADLRDPQNILKDAANLLDLAQPVALLAIAVLHFLPDSDDPDRHLQHLLTELCDGSYLAITHATFDPLPASQAERLRQLIDTGEHGFFRPRSYDEVERLLAGLDLVDPGITPTIAWRPDLSPQPQIGVTAEQAATYAAIAQKRRSKSPKAKP